MSAPRPYETDPLHPQSSVHILHSDQILYIYKTIQVISSIWYLHCVLEYCRFVIYACALPEPLISRLRAILKWFFPCMWYVSVRDTARHCR